jgi:hypothetical protein
VLNNNCYILNGHNYQSGKTNPETRNGVVSAQYNQTTPIFITAHYTFWILGYEQKAVYTTASTFNEVFQQYYLNLFNQLLAAIYACPEVVSPLNTRAEPALLE